MLKRLLGLATALAMAVMLTACPGTIQTTGGTPVSANQQAINLTTTSYNGVDAAILTADAAVKSGTLKGNDARNALKGLTDAKAGLDVALVALRAANAAAAAAAASAPATGVKP